MDINLNDIATLLALLVSLVSIGGVVFGAGRLVEAVNHLQQTVETLRGVLQDVIRDLREQERFSERVDERLGHHARRIDRIQEEASENSEDIREAAAS